ncbi:unnamed protein product [Closterium sp. NIES-54]
MLPVPPASTPAATHYQLLSALPCTLHCLALLPCQATAAACCFCHCCCHCCLLLLPLLPATATAAAGHHHCLHALPSLPCPAWPPPTLPCPLPSAALPCLATANTALPAAQRCPALPSRR